MTVDAAEYRVLARKYRPKTFADLIGHDALVRTLTNAIAGGRIGHAFMLTGVRGVGKTTTARIIARALNCVGPDGTGGPTIAPCGVCEPCRAIAEDRHVDVIEMDAASRTGVDDIRELTDGMRYRPVAARYKIYIIDEVHMLSKNAFNALLKSLEEPPPDIKFIFATTEINKVPVTVLSRCQRYTLPRIATAELAGLYQRILEAEAIAAEPAAVALIARVADGSARDGLSILDQAIALSLGGGTTEGGGLITEASVRDMLGIADRGLALEIFEAVMRGDAATALATLTSLHRAGAEPALVLQDLLEITHLLTRLKLDGTGEAEGNAPESSFPGDAATRARSLQLAERLGMAVLTRTWQMLLKGLGEVQTAPQPLQAAEMVLIRLVYVADLPSPAEVVRGLVERGGGPAAHAPTVPGPIPATLPALRPQAAAPAMPALATAAPIARIPETGPRQPVAMSGGAAQATAERVLDAQAEAAPAEVVQPVEDRAPAPLADFRAVLELVAEQREILLYTQLASSVHLVRFEPGRIEFRPAEGAPRDLANRLGQKLGEWTGMRWVVSVSQAEGEPTPRQQAEAAKQRQLAEANTHPLVRAALATFPGATIMEIRERGAPVAAEPGIAGIAPDVSAINPGTEPTTLDEAPMEADDPGPLAAYSVDDEDSGGGEFGGEEYLADLLDTE
ncbi:MAG TPA: DNA polymerase III subunit gamma/tau [Stellaceae bacterium]|nr:DNA polymerase III subunit gamma/tau [Stellaceae bacterium]